MAFFKRASDIPSGWRQLTVEECSKWKKRILDVIGACDVYHLRDGRIRGLEHGGSVDGGQFDTFGVKKKFMQKEEDDEKVRSSSDALRIQRRRDLACG